MRCVSSCATTRGMDCCPFSVTYSFPSWTYPLVPVTTSRITIGSDSALDSFMYVSSFLTASLVMDFRASAKICALDMPCRASMPESSRVTPSILAVVRALKFLRSYSARATAVMFPGRLMTCLPSDVVANPWLGFFQTREMAEFSRAFRSTCCRVCCRCCSAAPEILPPAYVGFSYWNDLSCVRMR